MKKLTQPKKLQLVLESIAALGDAQLRQAAGGSGDQSLRPNVCHTSNSVTPGG